jgi:hypothetical protein
MLGALRREPHGLAKMRLRFRITTLRDQRRPHESADEIAILDRYGMLVKPDTVVPEGDLPCGECSQHDEQCTAGRGSYPSARVAVTYPFGSGEGGRDDSSDHSEVCEPVGDGLAPSLQKTDVGQKRDQEPQPPYQQPRSLAALPGQEGSDSAHQ